jgi:hypothetical protein
MSARGHDEGSLARGVWRGEFGEGSLARGVWRGEFGEGSLAKERSSLAKDSSFPNDGTYINTRLHCLRNYNTFFGVLRFIEVVQMTLFEDIVELDILPGAASVTSTKPWAQRYDPVEQYRLNPSTQIAFDTIFGESTEGDGPRYDQAVVQAPEIKEYVRTEGDVARVFNKHIGGPVMEFWNGQWYITQSSESSPFRSSSFEGVVDTQFVKIDSGYHQLAIVEFKAPGTIAPSWSTGGAQSSGTKRLGRELRGLVFAP